MVTSQKERGPDLQYRNKNWHIRMETFHVAAGQEQAPATPLATLGQAHRSHVVPRDWSGNGSYLPPGV